MGSTRLRAFLIAGLTVIVLGGFARPTQSSTPAAETGIFGIVLLKPLKGFPECKIENVPANEASLYRQQRKRYQHYYGETEACFEHSDYALMGHAPTGTERLKIRWPYEKKPEMCKSLCDSMEVSVINGVVHGLVMETSGVRDQQRDYESLVSKFGAPTNREPKIAQDQTGQSLDVIDATWDRPGGVTVLFTGAAYEVDTGMLSVVSNQEIGRLTSQAMEAIEIKQP
jgi:hypothetical protein